MHRSLRTALPATIATLVIATSPAAAFQPSVEVVDFTGTDWTGYTPTLPSAAIGWWPPWDPGWAWHVVRHPLERRRRPDMGLGATPSSPARRRMSSRRPPCVPDGRSRHMPSSSMTPRATSGRMPRRSRCLRSRTAPWSASGVIARRPDVACVANTELAVAWFERLDSGGYKVVLETGTPSGADPPPNGSRWAAGSPSRGLSVAVTSDRVYVAWFQGSTLKVRRYRIGTQLGAHADEPGHHHHRHLPGRYDPRDRRGRREGGGRLHPRRGPQGPPEHQPGCLVRLCDHHPEPARRLGGRRARHDRVRSRGTSSRLGTIDVGGIDTLYGRWSRLQEHQRRGRRSRRLTTHTGGPCARDRGEVGLDAIAGRRSGTSRSRVGPGLVRFHRK